ncbi:dihydropteroate synthase [Aquimarina sp. AD1]|uniref:dihydropteroate synthase n=1 Tax=Aquimarina sp. (strain AD1) TaxID=1714848 RepID=UPI000E46D5DB|nr:dihydropteroate synthase [Aquimarina sp. AD1]AXT56347.1 dihydropteroate synthase [Aquimarina sp. AD1]RKN13196.1 dihydropteroate synthase [Aquimarina sp. AD1]
MTINCKGSLIDLSTPKVMGILNLTPDSFYDGGKYKDESQILHQAEKMLREGATFIDLGAYSSRPGADHISIEEEENRILPIITLLLSKFPNTILSIDTFRSKIAKQCVEAGASIINDISAGSLDKEMIKTVGKLKVPYIMMHMKGTPQTMKSLNQYDNLIKDVQLYFSKKIIEAKKEGINDIIIDPGFGFAKNINQNFELLKKLDLFNLQGLPILVGVSRKSMIYKSLKIDPSKSLNGTTSLNTIALLKGASILRVHDVKEAMECITLMNKYKVQT